MQSLRNIIKRLRKHGLNSPLEEAQLLVMGREVAIVNSPRAIENLLSEPGHLYLTPGMVLNLRKLIADVERQVARLNENNFIRHGRESSLM